MLVVGLAILVFVHPTTRGFGLKMLALGVGIVSFFLILFYFDYFILAQIEMLNMCLLLLGYKHDS